MASINSSSRSAWSCKASATRCQTPYSSQRAKRIYTECQLPSSLGKSRHGQPVRARYRTASTKRRLSGARPPLSVGLPGSRFSIPDRSLPDMSEKGLPHEPDGPPGTGKTRGIAFVVFRALPLCGSTRRRQELTDQRVQITPVASHTCLNHLQYDRHKNCLCISHQFKSFFCFSHPASPSNVQFAFL